MAERPVFLPTPPEDTALVRRRMVTFRWYAGMALARKRLNVESLHAAAAEEGLAPLLEASTKSADVAGQVLSAFNLRLPHPELGEVSVEAAFQGSKVFDGGGPFHELYARPGGDARRDPRLRESGRLTGFDFAGERWPLTPTTAFYDWLYLQGLRRRPELAARLREFAGFTDIEFNPDRSLNCQAAACALWVALERRSLLPDLLDDRAAWLQCMTSAAAGEARHAPPTHADQPRFL